MKTNMVMMTGEYDGHDGVRLTLMMMRRRRRSSSAMQGPRGGADTPPHRHMKSDLSGVVQGSSRCTAPEAQRGGQNDRRDKTKKKTITGLKKHIYIYM